ncbi:hypothetical protein GCM10010919_07530 [Alishewanella longhuensis]|uniref:LysM domain-containing protein n=1 Tax=Alishewanella longhuensis TaxID=1091037 RepID=A0ABQ3KUQ5_9ALTE|nr:type IV pilus biogenesis/stability protein PilW [Alishewanella longhuensis]GHG62304.1 hypothetical protein GCM10010919_07530 [Alishewanella longhuensis]
MQKYPVVTALTALFILSGCVSESTYVANDRQVTQRNVDNTEAAKTRISLGLNYLRRGDTTQALFNLERARSMAPNLPEVYNALAFYYQTVGEQVQAENAYKQAIAKDSNNADAYNNYGAFLCQIDRFEDAERLLLSAISKPGYIRVAESYENLALCKLEQDSFEQARTYLSSSISHNGTRVSTLINSAAVNYAMGNLADAKADLQRIQRLGRVSPRSTLLSFLVAEKQGDVPTMRHAEQLLLSLYIDSTEARLVLQQRVQESEFEQLRERYKLHMLANLKPTFASTGQVALTQPVANPQLRIRRKTAEEPSVQPVVAVSEQSATVNVAAVVTATAVSSAVSNPMQQPQPLNVSEPLITATESLTVTNNSNSAASFSAEQAEPGEVPYHLVSEGESLHSISVNYNILLARLQEWNKLTPESRLRVGQRVWLGPNDAPPEPQAPPVRLANAQPVDEYYHLVADGDTMFAISYRYNIRLERFMAWNELTERSRLKIGQKLYIVDPASINHE